VTPEAAAVVLAVAAATGGVVVRPGADHATEVPTCVPASPGRLAMKNVSKAIAADRATA
jgi:hypothetical protein